MYIHVIAWVMLLFDIPLVLFDVLHLFQTYWDKETSMMGIGHVNEYPTMHYFGIPIHTQSLIAFIRVSLSISGGTSERLHCGNVVNIPYCLVWVLSSIYEFAESQNFDNNSQTGQPHLRLTPWCHLSKLYTWHSLRPQAMYTVYRLRLNNQKLSMPV